MEALGELPIFPDAVPWEEAQAVLEDHALGDGLPLVPPTRLRLEAMLAAVAAPDKSHGQVPPLMGELTAAGVAYNCLLAGCQPAELAVVLSAAEACLEPGFNLLGILTTTGTPAVVTVVHGGLARTLAMNAGSNCLGPGNRANATMGRAVALVMRNIGGARPGIGDMATMGQPGKYTFCFAEDEEGSQWDSLAVERGFAPEASTVTLFAGDGVQAVADQKSRTPESLARTFAACLRVVDHPKMAMAGDAFLIISPEHERVFNNAGWSKARLKEELDHLLMIPGAELVAGAGGIAEGLPASMADQTLPKFRPGGLNIVRAGGGAGMFSAVIGGWAATGKIGSIPVTKEITL